MWKGSRKDRVPVVNKAGLSRLVALTKDKRARAKLSHSKVAERRSKMLALRVAVIVVLLVSFLGALSWLSFTNFLMVQEIKVEGNKSIKTRALQAKILEYTSSPILFLFSKQNILLYPRAELESILLFEFPKAQSIEIKVKPTHRSASVIVVERAPYALWCSEGVEAPVCYYVDKSGFVFERAVKPEDDFLIFNNGLSRSTLNALRAFVKPKYFSEVNTFVDELRKIGLIPIRFIFEKNDARVVLQPNWELRIALDKDLRATIFNLKAVVNDNDLRKNLNNIQYIDMRFDERVYYKFDE